jgi:hypothetical protein
MTDIERELRETMREQASRLVRAPLATRALIRRARLRRAGTVAVAGAMLTAVTIGGVTLGRSFPVGGTIEPADRPQTPSTAGPARVGFIGLPPEGATPSSPISSELVLHYFGEDPAGWGKSNAWVYADGRLIVEREATIPEGANTMSTGFLEQRLTSEGVETMRTYVVSHGEPLPGEPSPSGPTLRVRQGGRLVSLDPAPGFDPERLVQAASWLPESAWEDKKLRAYVPSEFAVCSDVGQPSIEPGTIVESFPAAAADQLRNTDWVSVKDTRTGHESEVVEYCWLVGTDEARTIVGALNGAGAQRGNRTYVLEYVLEVRTSPEAEPKEARIGFEPVLPNGDWTCSPCG